jgi:hypothetical protein
MGGPWRERGFDARALRPPRPHGTRRVEAVAREEQADRLARIVLGYIAAVVISFGLMVSFLQHGW